MHWVSRGAHQLSVGWALACPISGGGEGPVLVFACGGSKQQQPANLVQGMMMWFKCHGGEITGWPRWGEAGNSEIAGGPSDPALPVQNLASTWTQSTYVRRSRLIISM